jgi:hypothetical protein
MHNRGVILSEAKDLTSTAAGVCAEARSFASLRMTNLENDHD